MIIDDALATIEGASVLSVEDTATLHQLAAELKITVDTVQIFRTRTEMEYSVLNDLKLPTPDAKYWQCVREQNGMLHELAVMSFEYRKDAVELKKLQRSLSKEKDQLERETLQIDIEQLRFKMDGAARMAQDRMREIVQWSEIKAALIPAMKHGIEDVDAHQAESLPIRFANMAAQCTDHTPPADRINLIGLHLTAQNRGQFRLAEKGGV